MGVSHKTIRNDIPKITKELEVVKGKAVEVGVFNGEHAWLAAIHEYGLDIEVTPEMRAYLRSKGLNLKKTTTHIHIPERSFLRSGYDQNRDKVAKNASVLLGEVAAGTMSATTLCEGVGLELSSKIRDYAVDLQSPANHPFTIEQKGSSNPLVGSSGNMIEGINYRVVDK